MRQIMFLYLLTAAGAAAAGVWCGLSLGDWIAADLIFALALFLGGMGLGVWSCLPVEARLRCEESDYRVYVLHSTQRLADLLERHPPGQLMHSCAKCHVILHPERETCYAQTRDGKTGLVCVECAVQEEG